MTLASLLWRLVVLTFALVVEGTLVAAVGLYAAARLIRDAAVLADRMPPADAGDALAYLAAASLAALWAALHALTPWVVAVAITEAMRWRSVLVHLAAGALVALAAAILSGAFLVVPALQVIVALGIVGGFIHWLIAGRNAGRWSEPETALPPPRMPGPGPSGASGPSGPATP